MDAGQVTQLSPNQQEAAKPRLQPTVCLQCKSDEKQENEEWIECCICGGWQHFRCLPYNKTQMRILANDEISWKCYNCKSKKPAITTMSTPTTPTTSADIVQLIANKQLTEDKPTNASTSPKYSNEFERAMLTLMTTVTSKMDSVMEGLNAKADTTLVTSVSADLAKLEERVRRLESSNPPAAAATPQNKNTLSTQINDALTEEKDKERRKLNITIGGIPESTAASATDKRSEDSLTVKNVLKNIGVDVTPVSTQRVGKTNNDKPRILLVKLPTTKDKGQALKSAYKLGEKAETKNYSIRPDLTPRQQEQMRRLREELKRKKSTVPDPDNWRIDYRRWEVVHRPPNP